MDKVDFFLVGAPKSGTTALYTYLSTHPDIFFPSHKEPNFFARDYPNIGGRLKTWKEYEKLFAGRNHELAGDASVCYLGSDTAPGEIKKYNPHAKIIIMLRNPVELFVSEHSQLLYSFYEDIEDPFSAWKMQGSRLKGENIPSSCREPSTLQYKKVCRLGKNLNNYRNLFNDKNILVIFFEDFVRSPEIVYHDVLGFLGLKNDRRTDFPKINEAKYHKRGWLARWFIAPPGLLGVLHERLRRYIAVNNKGMGASIEQLIRKLTSKNSIKKTTSRKLPYSEFNAILKELKEDIDLLSFLTKRNLSHWKIYKN